MFDKKERVGIGILGVVVSLCLFGPLVVGYLDGPSRFRNIWPGLLIGEGVVVVSLGIVGGLAYWLTRRRARRMREILAENAPEPAFDMGLDIQALRRDPAMVEALQGKVAKVCVMRNMAGTGGGVAGPSLVVRFASFVIDSRGVAHDIEKGSHHHQVLGNAEWLAGELGVDVDDTSYGG